MSALPPKADIGTQSRNVRFVPIADIQTAYYSSRAAAATAANRPKTNVPKPSTMSARIGNARPNIASDGRLTAGKVISNAAAPAPPRPNCCRTWIIGTSPRDHEERSGSGQYWGKPKCITDCGRYLREEPR